MKKRKTLSLVAVVGLAHWFFGNLYEQIVFAPNMLADAYAQLKCWQDFFTVTNQIYYYVPFSQLAVFIVWYLFLTEEDKPAKVLLLKASVSGFLALALTAVIVTQLNLKLFFGDPGRYREDIYAMSVLWIVLNGVRVCIVGAALHYTFRGFLLFRHQTA